MDYPPLAHLTQEEILVRLNQALAAERQAVADYDAHAQAGDPPDVQVALETLRDVEREHAARLMARIVELGGRPTGQTPEPGTAGDTLATRLEHDLRGEQWAIVEYARLVAGILDDEKTVELMAELLLDEIRHARWLKATLRALHPESPAA